MVCRFADKTEFDSDLQRHRVSYYSKPKDNFAISVAAAALYNEAFLQRNIQASNADGF